MINDHAKNDQISQTEKVWMPIERAIC